MSIKERKLGFYYLELLQKGEEDSLIDTEEFVNVINYISGLKESDRVYNMSAINKFTFIESLNVESNMISGFFTTAKYHHSPMLYNLEAAYRDNPKELDEGEGEKSHFAMRVENDIIYLVLEERKVGVSIGTIVTYLNKFSDLLKPDRDYIIRYSCQAKSNFYEELKKLNRAVNIKLYTNAAALEDDFSALADRADDIRETSIVITAKRSRNIRDIALNLINEGSEITDPKISKIRVVGKSDEGNRVVLDTEFMRKIERIEVDTDEALGTVNTEYILTQLKNILDS